MAKEKPTTKICKHCKSEIPYDAKVCPQCRKKQKGGVLKWVIIALVALIVIGAMSGGSGKNNSSTKKVGTVSDSATSEANAQQASDAAENSETADPTAPETEVEEEAPADVPTVYHVGDILMDGDMRIVYMSSGEYTSDNDFLQPKDGYKYIFLQFSFENTSTTTDNSISFYSFNGYADGYEADMFYGGDDDLSATLSAGRNTTGTVIFEVPVDSKDTEIEYEPNFFTQRKITFIYDGEQDSGYIPEANTTASADAFHVGDIVEAKNLRITYVSSDEYESENMFIQPKDGYHFVTCKFEFENIGSSDETVTAFSFDCYADGASCDQTFAGDDTLSATLSAGRKTSGSVIFEVPDNASVVEVEYLTNYWTSNRIVFAVE